MVFDWNAEIRPVLDALQEAIDSNDYGYVESDEINAVLGRAADDQSTDLALSKLRDAGLIVGYRGAEGWSNCTLAEKSLQTVAGWPVRPGDDTYELLLATLAQRIESARPRRRSRNGSSSEMGSRARGETSPSTS